MSTIKRSEGRSATAAAAYIACCLIEDKTTGEVFDYRRKGGLAHAFTVLPDGSSADRTELWNAAETAEKRRNSVVARSLVIALPHEADDLERQQLVAEHARFLAKRHGVAVDVAIHEPPREGDQRNHHAHLLITTRRVETDGQGRIKLGDKTRELDVRKTGSEIVTEWRQSWENTVNARLKAKDVSLSMKSLKAQGIDRTPGLHLGPAITALTRKERRLRKQRRELYVVNDPARRELVRSLRRAASRTVEPLTPATPPVSVTPVMPPPTPALQGLTEPPSTGVDVERNPLITRRNGEPRSRRELILTATILHAQDRGDTPLLDAATRLLMLIWDVTAKAAKAARDEILAWGQTHDRSRLPKPLTTPEACKAFGQAVLDHRAKKAVQKDTN